MFSNFFQSVKEVANVPVQDGQKIRKGSNASAMSQDELTEEGFVSIGRSSFICVSPAGDEPYPLFPQNNIENERHVQMPVPYFGQDQQIPTHDTRVTYPPLQSHSSLEINDAVRNVPFVLHPDLKESMQKPTYWSGLANPQKNLDFSEFNYDFELERGVLREIYQNMEGNAFKG